MTIKTPLPDKNYRPDIDGLRAIAVMAVVLFHLEIFPFTGGYIGVDVFFVISGFLITRILCREVDEGRFSIIRFYERRMRRIAPALFAVVFVSLIAGYFIFMPKELTDLGKSIRYTLLMGANIYWWKSLDYFSAPQDTKPMLHMWSLGVEEQFYLFLPLILLFVAYKFPRWRAKIVWVLLLISLVMSVIYLPKHSSLVFYWLPFRAWELLAGSVLVFLPFSNRLSSKLNELLAVVGVALLVTPIFYLQSNSSFPGFNAVAPVLGSALLIWTGTGYKSIVARLLSFKPFVYIGLISYSLYLWHWPMIVYARYWFADGISLFDFVMLVIAIFAASILSYHFVERPFRNKKKVSAKIILFFTIIGSVVLFIGGTIYMKSQGLPNRLPDDVKAYVSEINKVGKFTQSCIGVELPFNVDPMGKCHLGVKDKKPTILLLGDSFSSAIAEEFGNFLANNNQSGIIVSGGACPPVIGIGAWASIGMEQCEAIHNNILDAIDKWHITTVVLYARWPALENPKDFKWIKVPQKGSFKETLNEAFARTIQAFEKRGLKIVIIEGAPIYNADVPMTMARKKMTNSSTVITMPLATVIENSKAEISFFAPYKNDPDILFIDLKNQLCLNGICYGSDDDKPLYWDNAHLNAYGSKFIMPAYDVMKKFLNWQE